MARLTFTDERGAVYVEFLIAFFPVFLLFLALCQLALVAAAEVVVRHAAFSAVRSAVVVLDDDPERFDQAERGSLSQGDSAQVAGIDAVVEKLVIHSKEGKSYSFGSGAKGVLGGIGSRLKGSAKSRLKSEITSRTGVDVDAVGSTLEQVQRGVSAARRLFRPHQGARMVPIQTAALLPLLPLSPSVGLRQAQSESIGRAIESTAMDQLGCAAEYTKAATMVTMHDAEGTDAAAIEPIEANAPITVKVRYLFHCTVPVVRTLMCRSLERSPIEEHWRESARSELSKLVNPDARFKLLTASATLPNQSAAYCPRGGK